MKDFNLFYEELSKLRDDALEVKILEALGLARAEEFNSLKRIDELEHLFIDAGVSLSHDDPQSFKDFKEVRENLEDLTFEIMAKALKFQTFGKAALRRFVNEDGVLIACDNEMAFHTLHLQCRVQEKSFMVIRRRAVSILHRMVELLQTMTARDEEE